jgi:hypothetical protein
MSMQVLKATIRRRFPALVPVVQTLRLKFRRPIERVNGQSSISEVFDRVYSTNYWGNPDSRSGSGSDLTQTEVIRAEIPKLIKELSVETMLDIPCGDFFWMQQCDLGIEFYIGADIVPSLIRELNARCRNDHRIFEILDLTKDPLPKVDLVLCRDALVHLSSNDIKRAVANLKQSGSSYLLATTFTDRNHNLEIATSGDWRPLNLEIAPISFPRPLRLINEGCTEDNHQFKDKSLGLWRLEDL